MHGRRPVPRLGAVLVGGSPLLPYVVVDEEGSEVEPGDVWIRLAGELTRCASIDDRGDFCLDEDAGLE
jgi:hypothetical protein